MSSSSRKSSPPPLNFTLDPPPPLPSLDFANRTQYAGSPNKSVKLVTSRSANSIAVNSILKTPDRHVLQCSKGNLPSRPTTPTSKTEPPAQCRKLQARWSGYVPRDRPPSDHGKSFMYSIPNRFPEVRAKELCRILNELSPERFTDACTPRHRRISSLSDLARLVPGHAKAQSDAQDRQSAPLRGISLTFRRSSISRKHRAGSKTVSYKQTPKSDRALKSVRYGRIVNNAMNWENLEKWGRWEQDQWDGVHGMSEYADRGLDTVAFRINDVDESRRSKVMMEDVVQITAPQVPVRSSSSFKPRRSFMSEARMPPLGPPPNLLATPRAESLHFDPSNFKVKEESPPRIEGVAKEQQPPGTNESVPKIIDSPAFHQKKGSRSSIAAFTSRFRHRSRSPLKRESSLDGKKPGREENGYARFRNFLEYHQKRQLRDQNTDNLDSFLKTSDKAPGLPLPSVSSAADEAPPKISTALERSPSKQKPMHQHNKSISIASTASIADAKTVSISRPGTPKKRSNTTSSIPRSPGPAPCTELPPVPEGIAQHLPRTPRNSISNRQGSISFSKPGESSEKFSLYPSVSPAKQASSPSKTPAVRVRMIRAESFPKPPSLAPSPERSTSVKSSPTKIPNKSPRRRITIDAGRGETAGSEQRGPDFAKQTNKVAENADNREKVDFLPGTPSLAGFNFKLDQGASSERLRRNDSRHSKRESHITEDILSEYTDNCSEMPSSSIPEKYVRADRPVQCEVSSIMVNAEQPPERPSRPLSTVPDQNKQSLDSRIGLDASPFTYEATLRDVNEQRSTSDSAVPMRRADSLPDRTAILKSHEALFRSVNRSSFHSSQRSSQRSSMVDSAMEARLSQLEHSNLLLREAIMAIVNASTEVGVNSSGGGVGFDDREWVSAGRKDPKSVGHGIASAGRWNEHHDVGRKPNGESTV